MTRGEARVIADVEHRVLGDGMSAESMARAFFGCALRRSLDNTPFGWPIVAVTTVPAKDRS